MSKNKQVAKTSSKSEHLSIDEQEELEQILSKLPKEARKEIRTLVTEAAFSGPLPPPSMFEHYEQVLPGAANRIIAMAEKEQTLRQRDTGWMLTNDTIRVIASLLVSLLLIAAAVYLGLNGQPWLGGVLGTSGVFAALMRNALKK